MKFYKSFGNGFIGKESIIEGKKSYKKVNLYDKQFNKKKELYLIKPEYKKNEVSDNYIKNWYQWLKTDPVIRDQYEYYMKTKSSFFNYP